MSATRKTTTICSLPNELLQSILCQLDLAERLPLRLVSHRWDCQVRSLTLQCRGLALQADDYFPPLDQQSLRVTFFLSKEPKNFDFEHIRLRRQPDDDKKIEELALFLGKLFPSLTHLAVQAYSVSSLVECFSANWPKLQGLFMHGYYYYFSDQNSTLGQSIGALESLESLHLSGRLLPLIPELLLLKNPPGHQQTIFRRLTTLSIVTEGAEHTRVVSSGQANEYIGAVVRQLGPSCRRLTLGDWYLRFADLAQVPTAERTLSTPSPSPSKSWLTNLTTLEVRMRDGAEELVKYLAAREQDCLELDTLRLHSQEPIKLTAELFGSLALLSNLRCLELSPCRVDFERLEEEEEETVGGCVLRSVRECDLGVKHLIGPVNGHRFAGLFSRLLPAVERLTLRYNRILNLADVDQHWAQFPRLTRSRLAQLAG